MTDVSSIRALIGLWPQRSTLAEDMNRLAGQDVVTVSQVQKWAETQSIPAKFHRLLVRAAELHGYPVTADLLADLHHLQARVGRAA